MPRYILINNNSGRVFADIRHPDPAASPMEAARICDAEIGEHGREYEEVGTLGLNDTGYFVWLAEDAFQPIEDGADRAAIDAVKRLCKHAGTIRVTDGEGRQ